MRIGPRHDATWLALHWVDEICYLGVFIVRNRRFYQRVSIASYANRWYSQRRNVRLSVRLSICHTPVLYQNEES